MYWFIFSLWEKWKVNQPLAQAMFPNSSFTGKPWHKGFRAPVVISKLVLTPTWEIIYIFINSGYFVFKKKNLELCPCNNYWKAKLTTIPLSVSISSVKLWQVTLEPQKERKWIESVSGLWPFAIPWIIVLEAPLSVEFSRQEYWSG